MPKFEHKINIEVDDENAEIIGLEKFHISLSKTVYLKHMFIKGFVDLIEKDALKLDWLEIRIQKKGVVFLLNEQKTAIFVALKVEALGLVK